jgi:hypothetical protein
MSVKILVLRAATKSLNGLAAFFRKHPAVVVRMTEFVLGSAAALVVYGGFILIKFCVAG